MRLKGYFTVEAAYIFPFITLLVAGFIFLDFRLHDDIVSDTAMLLGGLRYRSVEAHYYNEVNESVDYMALIEAPVVGNSSYTAGKKDVIDQNVKTYFEHKRLGAASELSDTDYTAVISNRNNAEHVRAGGKVVSLIGGD